MPTPPRRTLEELMQAVIDADPLGRRALRDAIEGASRTGEGVVRYSDTDGGRRMFRLSTDLRAARERLERTERTERIDRERTLLEATGHIIRRRDEPQIVYGATTSTQAEPTVERRSYQWRELVVPVSTFTTTTDDGVALQSVPHPETMRQQFEVLWEEVIDRIEIENATYDLIEEVKRKMTLRFEGWRAGVVVEAWWVEPSFRVRQMMSRDVTIVEFAAAGWLHQRVPVGTPCIEVSYT